MRLRWTPEAAENLESIHRYLCEHFPSLALSTVRTLYDSARSLRKFPARGRPGSLPATRELILQRLPYIIVYRIADDVVEIVHIFHSAQDR